MGEIQDSTHAVPDSGTTAALTTRQDQSREDETRPCFLCGRTAMPEDFLGSVAANHHNRKHLSRQHYSLVVCTCSDLIYLSPLPADADIRAMYAETEQFTRDEDESPYRGERGTAVLEFMATSLVSLLRSSGISLEERFSVLEVGAGLSWMCRAAKILDWQNLTIAQDLSAETVDECRWVDHFVVEDLLTGATVDAHGPFDVISLTHVFEHLADPVAMLRRLAGLLSPRGVIFITAPHRPLGWQRDSELERWVKWSYNHVPAHLQYFSRDSFARAAEASGLSVAAWNDQHEGGQALEGWLRHATGGSQ